MEPSVPTHAGSPPRSAPRDVFGGSLSRQPNQLRPSANQDQDPANLPAVSTMPIHATHRNAWCTQRLLRPTQKAAATSENSI